MANYKSQYTGEQIDEAVGKALSLDVARILSAVEKVETATNIYNYDGTVIIEKAESVLGLRRFKESVDIVGSINVADLSEDLLDEYGFDIVPILISEGASNVPYFLKLSCAYNVTDEDSITKCSIIKIKETIEGIENYYIAHAPIDELLELTFNVRSTPNSTVDEWLLANTEEVSV